MALSVTGGGTVWSSGVHGGEKTLENANDSRQTSTWNAAGLGCESSKKQVFETTQV